MFDSMFFEDNGSTGSQYGAEEGLAFGLEGDCTNVSHISDSEDGSEIVLSPSASRSNVTDKASSGASVPNPKLQPVGCAAKFAAPKEVGKPVRSEMAEGLAFC